MESLSFRFENESNTGTRGGGGGGEEGTPKRENLPPQKMFSLFWNGAKEEREREGAIRNQCSKKERGERERERKIVEREPV